MTPHSSPSVADGGWITKATADHLREWSKYDELEDGKPVLYGYGERHDDLLYRDWTVSQ